MTASQSNHPFAGLHKEKVHLFLLAGQSNMAGRGIIEPEDLIPHPRIFSLSQESTWIPAVDPIHYDKPKVAGVGLASTFARIMIEEDPEAVIGLIPTACGGSPISTWTSGTFHAETNSYPYDNAVQRMERALPDGVLKGILWHQGEGDSKETTSVVYEEKLKALFEDFRARFDAATVPLIIGQLGQYANTPWSEARIRVDQAHRAIAN